MGSKSSSDDEKRETGRKREIWNAWALGARDAVESGGMLAVGMTWDDDQDLNEAYDAGANAGTLLCELVASGRAESCLP